MNKDRGMRKKSLSIKGVYLNQQKQAQSKSPFDFSV